MTSRRTTLVAGAAFLAAGTARANAQDAAAKQEGHVVVYWAGATERSNALTQRFRDAYGITVDFLRLGADQVPIRVMTEDRGGLTNVDAISMPALQQGLLVRAGLLAAYKPPERRDMLAGTFDADGYWNTVFMETEGIAYNPVRLRSLGIKPPVTWEDLARPEWRSQFAVATNDVEWYTALRKFYGKERNDRLMRALSANEPRMIASHTLGLTLITSGEILGMAAAYGPDAVVLKRKGLPLEFVNPTPTVFELDCLGIAKKAPHPNAARLFARWWLGRPTQQWFSATFGVPSARKDVKGDPELLNPHVRYKSSDPGDSVDYAADVQAFRSTFNIPG